MDGVVTRNEPETEWDEFALSFYEVKDVTGRCVEPISSAINMVSCFADNTAASEEPDLVPVDHDGRRATKEREYFDWSHIDPTHESYREGLLEIIEDCAAEADDVRLDDVGFPREGYCHCERCKSAFADSEFDDWETWRASVITEFVANAAERIPGRTYLTLYPDPYPGHLYSRSGIDLDALTPHVDEFVVPLYDLEYSTTYWLESLVRGFRTALGGSYEASGVEPETPFSVELYAVDVDVDTLINAAEVAAAYAENVFFGYDAAQASAAIRRHEADSKAGKTYGVE